MPRPDCRRRTFASGVAVLGVAWLAAAPSGTTYAAWSDFVTIPNAVGAGVWLTDGDPPLPDQCAGIVFDRILIGTSKDDTLTGTAGNDLVFGLQGKDVLSSLAGDDCLVGGNGKDELLGGDGDDVLVGGNAKDKLTGGADDDACDGGRGVNTLIQCAPEAAATLQLDVAPEPEATEESVLVLPDAPGVASTPAPAPLTGGGASVEVPPEAPPHEPTDVDGGIEPEQPADAPLPEPTGEVQP